MIYRKWSLLTGPPAIGGAVVGSVVLFHLLFKTGPSLISQPKKEEPASTAK